MRVCAVCVQGKLSSFHFSQNVGEIKLMCSVADCVTKYFFFFARARSQLRCFSASVWCGAAQTLFIFIRNFVCALRERFFLSVQHSDVMMMMFFHVVKNVGGCFVKDWFLFK